MNSWKWFIEILFTRKGVVHRTSDPRRIFSFHPKKQVFSLRKDTKLFKKMLICMPEHNSKSCKNGAFVAALSGALHWEFKARKQDWLTLCQYNVTEWFIMCALFNTLVEWILPQEDTVFIHSPITTCHQTCYYKGYIHKSSWLEFLYIPLMNSPDLALMMHC